MEIAPRITIDSAVHHGSPIIAGTRVPVALILGSLSGGMSSEDITREHAVTRQDIEASLACAADAVGKLPFTRARRKPAILKV